MSYEYWPERIKFTIQFPSAVLDPEEEGIPSSILPCEVFPGQHYHFPNAIEFAIVYFDHERDKFEERRRKMEAELLPIQQDSRVITIPEGVEALTITPVVPNRALYLMVDSSSASRVSFQTYSRLRALCKCYLHQHCKADLENSNKYFFHEGRLTVSRAS